MFGKKLLFLVGVAFWGVEVPQVEALPLISISSFAIPIGSWSGLASDGTNLVALNNADNSLYTINPNTGAVVSVLAIIQKGNYGGLAIDGGKILVGNPGIPGKQDRIYSIDPVTGSQTSFVVANDFGGGLAFFNNRLFYTNEASTAFEIDPLTGGILNSFNSLAPHINGMAFDGTSLYGVNAQDGIPEDLIRVFNPNTGAVLESFFAPSRSVLGLAFIGSTLYALDERNRIFVLTQSSTFPEDPNLQPPAGVIPEPSTLALFGIGALAMFGFLRKRKTKL